MNSCRVKNLNAPGWKKFGRVFPLVCGIALAQGSISNTFAQTTEPAGAMGTSSRVLGVIDLKNEVDGLSGRQLRSRYITIAPGGHSTTHGHVNRPTLEYIAQGHVIEVRNGVDVPHGPGEMVVATHDITHRWENRGTETVVLIPVDVFKE